MAYRATGNTAWILDCVVVHELAPQGGLIIRLAAVVAFVSRLPAHVEHLVARPDVLLRMAMAVQAPFHQQRRHLVGERHFVDLPMAGDAANAFLDVDAMVEIDEAGDVVSELPE